MKIALLLTFLLASSVVMAAPQRQGTNGRLTREAENHPGYEVVALGYPAKVGQGFPGLEASSDKIRQ